VLVITASQVGGRAGVGGGGGRAVASKTNKQILSAATFDFHNNDFNHM